ncbi:pyridoxamine 5'-phosphate oxidase [Ascobolus immersus RN42]|uniref:pyridoxal 5'-phosphate synthase n=1 Tax=Ascobolus immersus RN42 TaxID=1160509 RepID=A0A3N4IFY2_ASCIM|nr:pyridoxamine 5'-phosphate oxidase [Ascobolus immersus RN42]
MRLPLKRISAVVRHGNLAARTATTTSRLPQATPIQAQQHQRSASRLASALHKVVDAMTAPLEKTPLNPAGTTEEKLIFAPPEDQYRKGALDREHLDPDPVIQFHKWFKEAQASTDQAEALTLSTAHLPSGRVSSRIVYMKELTHLGFVVYSNFATSQKAEDLRTNPHASLSFWWKELERQVRVEGVCERISKEESQAYFDTRGRGSRIGAWASKQSQVIESREVLEGWGKEKIEVPEYWGGLRIRPLRVEFWQGRESRLHDRFEYVRDTVDGEWRINRLSP